MDRVLPEDAPRGMDVPSSRRTFALLGELMARAGMTPFHFLFPPVLALGVSVLEAASISLLVPLLRGVIDANFSFVSRFPVLRDVVGWVAGVTGYPVNSCAFFVLVFATFTTSVTKIGLESASMAAGIRLARMLSHQLRVLVFERYLCFGRPFFDRSNVGHLTSLLTSLTNRVAGELRDLNHNLAGVLQLVAYFGLMLWISWPVTLLVIAILPPMLSGGTRLVKGIGRASEEGSHASADLARRAFNVLSCIELVKAYAREDEELRRFTASSQALSDNEVALDIRRRLVGHGQQVIVLTVLLLLVVIMGALVMLGQARSIAGSLVYFYLLRRVASHFGVVNRMRASVAAMSGPVGEILSILDDEDKHIPKDGTHTLTRFTQAIRFEGVSFSYAPEVPVLQAVTLTIAHGQMTALVGQTGAGKTTLVRLLMRFYDAPQGSITIDGFDIRALTVASLRARMALVSQDTLVMSATIRENLTYGLDGVSEADLGDAISRARLDDLIGRLPSGLDTTIGDRGATLSGGERQRIAIARAMLKRADILILDEATSALDSKTELQIQQAIAELLRDKTSVVIAHRLSTIRDADRIVVLERGRIVEQGSPADLLQEGTVFSEYWRAQGGAAVQKPPETPEVTNRV